MIRVFAVPSSSFCFHHVSISLLINNCGKKKGNTLIDDGINQYIAFHWYKSPGGIFKKVDTDGYTTSGRWGGFVVILAHQQSM